MVSKPLANISVGNFSTAVGFEALLNDTKGVNTAFGYKALGSDDTGTENTAIGDSALFHNTGGFHNVALGFEAGLDQTTGHDNVYIGTGMTGFAGENLACYIASIDGQTSASGVTVLINSDGKLGTTTSSKRFKEDIKPMDKTSEAILGLKPVTFRYKKELDPKGIQQFGLVAEEVQKVNPALVALDKQGKPYSVRYEQVNAMLLNEFLKEHRKVQKQEAAIAELKSGMKALIATVKEQSSQIQKVSAQLEVSKPAPQTVLNNQ